ncbi:MAG: hypothetical protein ACOH2D_07265 [Gelidibacter sp.]|uniref:hypothetical protein n=1 Tax=Gelidibacter sp. TaxID=2018083 RepID=UPI00326434F3
MKTLKFLILISVIGCFVSCKKSEDQKSVAKVAVVRGENNMELPNKSDVAFFKAFEALKKKEYRLAGEHVLLGVQELTAEAKGALFNDQLNTNLKHLTDVAHQLQAGKNVNQEALRNLIANAEINVNHEYLMSDNELVMMKSEKANEARLHESLDRNVMNLETGIEKLEGNAKKESKKLEEEGKKLKEEFEAWNERVQEHTKNAEEHFRKYQPENVYTWGLYPLQ